MRGKTIIRIASALDQKIVAANNAVQGTILKDQSYEGTRGCSSKVWLQFISFYGNKRGNIASTALKSDNSEWKR